LVLINHSAIHKNRKIGAENEFSCKKDNHNTPPPPPAIPKIKTEWANNDVRTYSYDDKGRVTKIVYSLYGWDEYAYTDTGVVINHYDTTNTWTYKMLYKLDSKGLAILSTSTTSTSDTSTYAYTTDGYCLTKTVTRTLTAQPLRSWAYHYFYTNNNLDSIIETYTQGASSNSIGTYYDSYFTDKTNTIGNDNFGQSFLGKSSKNPFNAARDIGHTNDGTYPQTNYVYEYDSLSRIIKQTEHEGNSSFTTLNFTYY